MLISSVAATVQFLIIVSAFALSPYLPESPVQAALLLLVGAFVLAPIASRAFRAMLTAAVRTLMLGEPAPIHPHKRAVRVFRLPDDPGLPGSALARAPSYVVPASA